MTDQEARELAQLIQNAQDGDLCANGWSRKPGPSQVRAADAVLAWMEARGYRKHPEPEWEYVPGHRWVDRDGKERWFVQAGTIAPGYVDKYITEGGQVIKRQVGPWVAVGEEER